MSQKNKHKYATLAILALKSTKIIKAISLFKFAKPAITVASMALSVVVYSLFYNPWLVIGFVLLIFIHELGHVVALNRLGYKVSGPVFIPFIGAAITAPKGMSRTHEAISAIGGPVLGGVTSLILLAIYYTTGAKAMLILGYMGCFLNLFNMIPLSPLDGGRITQACGRYFSIIGIIILILATIALKNPGILLIWVIVFYDFDMLPVKVRLALASIAELTMIIMVVSGIGIPDSAVFWSTVADVVIGLCFLGMISMKAFGRDQHNECSIRPTLPVKQRIVWFLVWAVTSVVLFVAMLMIQPDLKAIVSNK